MKEIIKNWKLKLKYGKLKTKFKHITIIADGIVGDLQEGYECPPGRALMSMKVWATDYDEAADMIKYIGQQIGFMVDGDIQLFDTDPEDAPRENPFAYDFQFTPYEE